jgi:putative sterol carrier protein
MAAGPGSLAEAVEWFRKHFRPEAARGVTVGYRLVLDGGAGGELSVAVDRGRLEVREGASGTPDVVIRLAAAELFAILCGTANPDLLFMADRITVDGDLSLALKLRSLFGSPA